MVIKNLAERMQWLHTVSVKRLTSFLAASELMLTASVV